MTPAAACRIFISYRRNTSANAGRMVEWPQRDLPPGYIYLDVESGIGGEQFVARIQAEIAQARVVLVQALDDPSVSVRQAAVQALQRCAPDVLLQAIPEATQIIMGRRPIVTPHAFFGALVAGSVAKAIGDLQHPFPAYVDHLGVLLDWPHAQVRHNAAIALGKVRRNIPDSIKRRLAVLRRLPEPLIVREAADDALAEILAVEDGASEDEES